MEYIFELGSNPTISIAEIKAVLPKAKKFYYFKESNMLFLKLHQEIKKPQELLDTMGGTITIYKMPYYTQSCTVKAMKSYIDEEITFDHKVNFAITCINIEPKAKRKLGDLGMGTKAEYRRENKSTRVVQGEINAVHMIKNKLFPPHGIHVLVLQHNKTWYIGHAVAVQDIDSYSERDYEKPCRDAKNGMLPPKLAQIMINLAQPKNEQYVYDPFVGSGTVLIEALRSGFDIQGSDKYEKYIEQTQENVIWYLENNPKYATKHQQMSLFQSDAAKIEVEQLKHVGAVVSEGYLGTPHMSKPKAEVAKHTIKELMDIYSKMFETMSALKDGTRVVITFPVINTQVGTVTMSDKHLAILERYGFEKVDIVADIYAENFKPRSMVYGRDDQIVHREIHVFERVE